MDNQLHDASWEARLVRELSRLPPLAPSRPLADRVMVRVRLPEPRAVAWYRRARAWAMRPRHAAALAGAYAACAVAALAALVPWLAANFPAIGFATSWLAARLGGAIREGLLALAGWVIASGATDAVSALSPTGQRLWLALGAASVGYAGCVVGLHYLLRAPRRQNVVRPA